jgi:hypothetical protein
MELPVRTEDATAEFVTAALREGGALGADSSVAEMEHEPIGVGVGIVGQLARLTLRYEGVATGAPGSVVLKMPSQFPENRAIGDHFNFYEREGRFYREIGDKLGTRTPVCWWNLLDVERQRFCLLLEDLGQRTSISQVAGVSAARATEALVSLAALHREWWASPALDGLTWMPRLCDPVTLAAGQQYRDAWPLALERVGSALPEGAVALAERTQAVFEDVIRTAYASSPPTICHGDFRIDNLLYDDDARGADRVAVLDWQITSKGPGVFDVAYLLSGSMDVEERRASETEVLRAWWEALAIDGYSFGDAWRDYRRCMLITQVYGVTAAGAMDPANERGRQLVEAMAARAFTACLDLDAGDLL